MADLLIPSACPITCMEQPDPPEEVLQFTVGPEAVKLIFKRKETSATKLMG